MKIIYKKKEYDFDKNQVKTYQDIAKALNRNDLLTVCEVNGELKDLNASVKEEVIDIQFYNFESEKGKESAIAGCSEKEFVIFASHIL